MSVDGLISYEHVELQRFIDILKEMWLTMYGPNPETKDDDEIEYLPGSIIWILISFSKDDEIL